MRAAILDAGLDDWAEPVLATVRPSILFLRRQVPDASLPLGASKIGGMPSLPAGSEWPRRPAYRDADRKAAACRKLGAQLRESMAERRAERLSRPLQPWERAISEADVDAVDAEYEFLAETLGRPFPLSFVAQLDLAELAVLAGFDPALPATGFLRVFCDPGPYATDEMAVVWTEEAGEPRDPPADLLAYYVAHCASSTGPWSGLTHAEALLPVSAVDIPAHWSLARPLAGWLDEVEEHRPPAATEQGNEAYFGERLGGWPLRLQGNPEDELAAGRIAVPGQTPWRHLFSWGGEYWGQTKMIPIEALHDGNAAVMMLNDDMTAGRFDRARLVMHFT